jgi:hypothetical protein
MLTILTATHCRPVAIRLLNKWMKRQTYQDFRWVIVCDAGWEEYEHPDRCNYFIRRDVKPGEQHSMIENLGLGLEFVTGEKLLIVDDDEWLSRNYVETMEEALDLHDLFGIAPSFYYHLPSKRLLNLRNNEWAALTATGMRRSVFPLFRELLEAGDTALDVPLWRQWQGSKRLMQNDWITFQGNRALIVSMKGLPGAPGIGIGHNAQGMHDPTGKMLEGLMGPGDAEEYRNLRTTGELRR